MAKPVATIKPSTLVQVLLKFGVTLGEGEEAQLKPPGSTVTVSPDLADEIVGAGMGTLVPPAEVLPEVPVVPVPAADPVDPAATADPQLPLEEAK